VFERIRDIAIAVPGIRAAGDTDERLPPLLEDADSIADLMLAANTAIDRGSRGARATRCVTRREGCGDAGPDGPQTIKALNQAAALAMLA